MSDISTKVLCQDPISLTLLAGSLIGTYLFTYNDDVKDKVKRVVKRIGQKIGYYEGCEDYWIPGNIEGKPRLICKYFYCI